MNDITLRTAYIEVLKADQYTLKHKTKGIVAALAKVSLKYDGVKYRVVIEDGQTTMRKFFATMKLADSAMLDLLKVGTLNTEGYEDE